MLKYTSLGESLKLLTLLPENAGVLVACAKPLRENFKEN